MVVEEARFYMGKWWVFDNFSAFRVGWRGQVWQTPEHAYQAAKFEDGRVKHLIHDAPSPYEAKKLARAHAALVQPGWYDVRLGIMEEIIRAKHAQHEYVQRKLVQTGTMVIIEDSPTDSFWGRGRDEKGENHLGRIWMKLRDE